MTEPHATATVPPVRQPNGRQACPLCGGDSHSIFEKYSIPIHDCDSCQHRFAVIKTNDAHVAEVYGDRYFSGGGAGYADYLTSENLLRQHGRRLAHKLVQYTPPGTMLDVGCAAGFVLKGFQDAGWTGVGIEPNARMAAHAADITGAPVHVGGLEDYRSDRQFDLVMLVQVIAHFQRPRDAVSRAIELVKPNGLCLVETWDLDSWSARLLQQRWHEYSPPTVLHWFRFGRLESLFAELGCDLAGGGRLVKWIATQQAKSLLAAKLPDFPAGRTLLPLLKLIPDNVACPYLFDDLGWLVFRKRA